MLQTQEESVPLGHRERKKMLLSQLKSLSSQIVTDEDKIKAFAERWRSGFHDYSFANTLLILWQYSGATLCAGMRQWNKKGRRIKKGSKAIWILAPSIHKMKVSNSPSPDEDQETEEDKETRVLRGFLNVMVFAYEQTEGKELDMGNVLITGPENITVELLSQAFDIPVEFTQGTFDGYTDGKKIAISRRKNKQQESACYLHELAHIMLGHSRGIGGKRSDISQKQRELEAESVSYIVGRCIGLDNEGAKYYLGHYSASDKSVQESAVHIISTADKILRKLKPYVIEDTTQKGGGVQPSLFPVSE